MMAVLDKARQAFERQAWADAHQLLEAADGESPLGVDDIERLAVAAYLSGHHDAMVAAWIRAHHECVDLGDSARAARCAYWLGMELIMRGDHAQGGGWLARAGRLLEAAPADCAERGYLQVAGGYERLMGGDHAGAYEIFVEVGEIAARCGDDDLAAYGTLGRGQALVGMDRIPEGVALFDEAMVAVTAGELSPIVAGIVYCTVIATCHDILDLRRAQEWTEALIRWCQSQPQLVPYRGQCLVHRAELAQLHGRWSEALDAAAQACDRLAGQPAVGAAFYAKAEIHRLRGEFAEAEAAYRLASQAGHHPQPGLALLRLAEGRLDAAEAAVRSEIEAGGAAPTNGQTGSAPANPSLAARAAEARAVAAYVEVVLAAGDPSAASAAAERLATLATELGAPMLQALADHARGAVLLASGEPVAALAVLRSAAACYVDLGARYEAARVRVLSGLACRALGDHDTASLELDAATAVFRELGASPDLDRVNRLTARPSLRARNGLSPREVEVLTLVAAGKTNRAIAAALVISEKTVARHVSNLFTKLGVSSRAAATSYAYEHGLVEPGVRST